MSITLDIKNLSIALEALSRFPGAVPQSERILLELDHHIDELTHARRSAQAQYPAQTPPNPTDDDIPF